MSDGVMTGRRETGVGARLKPVLRAARGRGFTLFELMIVVGILVVLVAILVPTLGKVKDKARATTTRALMSNLQSDISAYFNAFHAYPGPLPASITTAASAKASGSQNLLLGLSYAMGTATTPPTAWPFALPSQTATGPIDYGNAGPTGSYQQLPAFFSPTPAQAFNFNANNANFGGMNSFACPAVMDSFPDGLPILYYRQSPGVTAAAAAGAAPANSPLTAGYYFDENKEYTNPPGGKISSSSGSPYYQNTAFAGGASVFTAAELNNLVSTGGSVHGGYVLISAGIDRYYGKFNGKASDDIVVIGGD